MKAREFITKTIGILSMGAVAFAFAATVSVPTTVRADASEAAMLARGGILYDRWYKVTSGDLPMGTHPSYSKEGKKKKSTTWRCKECHGWDYRGKDGEYKEGSHFTGVKGITGAAGKDPAEVIKILKDKTHGYTDGMFSEYDFKSLGLYVSKGQIDVTKYIGDDKSVKGDAKAGQAYYETICAGCHGMDGKKISDMPPVGSVVNKNPWESLHKIRFGQPAEAMPSLIALPLE
ncbi:MAG: c-type cytochrome, partial [Hyphomicrobiales bacterium]|nr:c-type cytochrome [Hyphomicrobiales bacterium]